MPDEQQENPRLFISYSWSSPEHEQRVLQFATELVESGVDVVLDKWDLREGHDAFAFMEKMVTDPGIKKVIMVCDRVYAEKADGRSGGVGTETQIISREVYEKEDQNKFVAVVFEKDEQRKAYLPTYYKSRIYIDLSEEEEYAKSFEQLLRWIYDKPLHIKPPVGKMPSHLTTSSPVAIGTSAKFKRAVDATRNSREHATGALSEYFEALINGIETFRISDTQGDFDEKVLESIEQFVPYRNEAIEMYLCLALYRNTKETHHQLHRFFEQLIPYLYRPESVSRYREWDLDNLKFIIHELFIYCIASLLKHECFDAVAYLVRHRYHIERNLDYGRDPMRSFTVFRPYLRSLEHRNKRLELRRLSLHSDLLKQRCIGLAVHFNQLMQADFVLYIRDALDILKENGPQEWWPETLLYKAERGGPFEIFSRAESVEYFNKLKCMFDIEEKEDLIPLMEAFSNGTFRVPQWEFESIYPKALMAFDKLATRP